VLYAEQPAAQ